MKTFVLSLALLVAGTAPVFAQTQVASWTFETTPPAALNNSNSITDIFADYGFGTASAFHADAASDWSSPVGNGSAHSLSVNTWGVGDYFQFIAPTYAYSGIGVSWDQTSSNTGPQGFKLAYSTDGSSFTDFANYNVLANASPNPTWSATTPHPEFHFNYDLSSVTALDNFGPVYFRLIDTNTVAAGTIFGSGGTNRVDNFTVTAIPEPSTYALLAGLVGFAGVLRRKRRCTV